MKELVTIVIPCKNEVKYIGHLLEDIHAQLYFNDVKIIIADAHSDDGTLQVIEYYEQLYGMNIEVVVGGKVDVARNNGLKLVETPYVFFIDADVQFFSNTLLIDTLTALMKGSKLVTAKLKCYRGSWSVRTAYRLYNFVHHFLVKKYPFAIGAYFCTITSELKNRGWFVTDTDNSGDFLTSQKYTPNEFHVVNHYIGQDDRRIKKMGIFGMANHLMTNFYNYLKGSEQFNEKLGYWD